MHTKQIVPNEPTVSLTAAEKMTLKQIAHEITGEDWRKFRALAVKFDSKTLTDAEYDTYLTLADRIEGVEVKRLEHLAAMAQYRNLSLAEFMKLSGLKSPTYG